MFLKDCFEDVSEVKVVDCFVGQRVVFLGIGAYFLLRPGYFNIPFMRALNVVLQLERALLSIGGFCGKFHKFLLQLTLVQLFTVSFLGTHIHLLCDLQQLVDHFLALRVNTLSGSCLMDSLKLCHL